MFACEPQLEIMYTDSGLSNKAGSAGSCECLAGCAGIKGNVVLYTTLMSVCRRGGQPEMAVRIFRTMESDGLQLDVVRPQQDLLKIVQPTLLANCSPTCLCG